MVTVCSGVVLGSANALRIRITISGKQGRSTVPDDTSAARWPRNWSAAPRASSGAAVPSGATDRLPDLYVGAAGTFDINALLHGCFACNPCSGANSTRQRAQLHMK